ncbi:Arylacetamide deacetylase [Handroanthus impetiginosus]|uniref:Arylacetamide deacetylase n=1 Tax=Handroanthus impetiginosus TaxID=429701 RepID=A0A2G9HFL4_9LAMI|nr:Arylacetamide deacetylase [Handroanthus impetiginosus]
MAQQRNPASAKVFNLLLFIFFFSICLSRPATGEEEHTWQEAFEALGIAWNPDGTLNRTVQIPMVPPTPSINPNDTAQVALSTDVFGTSRPYRLYRPINLPKNKKLPLIIYAHGGDFVLFSVSTVIFHNFCNDIAAQFPAIVVSVEYRLAPEHRLPAHYDDTLNAIFWVRDQALRIRPRHPYLEHADFSRVFLVGSSAGANIAFHVALRSLDFNLWPLKIKGLLLNQAYFGGENRTESEIRLKDDPYVALYVNDVLWTLALPLPANNRDHEFCNPLSGGSYLGRVPRLPPVYVKADYGDPLVDRSTVLVEMLRFYGVRVVYQYGTDGSHGIEQRNSTAAQELYDGMKKFIYSIGEYAETEGNYASL